MPEVQFFLQNNDEVLYQTIEESLMGLFDCSVSALNQFKEGSEGLRIIIGEEIPDIEENGLVKIIQIANPLRLGNLLDRAGKIIKLHQKSAGLPAIVKFGDYNFIPQDEMLKHVKTGEIVNLTDKEKEILFLLLTNNGNEIDRKTLLEKVWGFVEGVETHTAETHIYRLRQKIEPDPSSPRYIITSEKGYRLGVSPETSD